MYSMVILAALMGGGEASNQYYFRAPPCPCCVWPIFPLGGRVVFFWQGPAALSEQDQKDWDEYMGLLDVIDQDEARYLWNSSDREGKQKLLTQVRKMKARKQAELEEPPADPKKPDDKKPQEKKTDDKKSDDK